MKRNTTAARENEAAAGLERIKHLAEQLAPAPVNSRRRRSLSAAIRIEAAAYRKSLDTEQAAARDDAQAQPSDRRGPPLVSRRRTNRRSRRSTP